MVSLPVVLAVGGLLFGIGLYGALGQTNTIMVIMGVELMLGASMLNVVGFLRYSHPDATSGGFFVLKDRPFASYVLAERGKTKRAPGPYLKLFREYRKAFDARGGH